MCDIYSESCYGIPNYNWEDIFTKNEKECFWCYNLSSYLKNISKIQIKNSQVLWKHTHTVA